MLRASIDYVEQLLHILSRLAGQFQGTKPQKDIIAKDTESEVETLKQRNSPIGTRCLCIRTHFRFQGRHDEEVLEFSWYRIVAFRRHV
jgi:hypothetical protein